MNKYIYLAVTMILAGCAGSNPADPYEQYNRKVYAFNTTLDETLLKPVAKGYKAATPDLMRQGVTNAFSNMTEPRNMVNNLLQGRIVDFLESTHRFVFNSTFGLAGTIDLTRTFKLPDYRTSDFGMTLAYYGWKDSNYFLLPFLPPRTMRDQVGLGVDMFATNPRGHILHFKDEMGFAIVDNIDARARLLEADKISKKLALDDYTFQREAVMQYRKNQMDKSGIKTSDASYDDDEGEEFSISDIARQNADQ